MSDLDPRIVPLAYRQTRSLHKRFPMIPRGDLTQEMLLWCASKPAKVEEYLTTEPASEGFGKLGRAMYNAALKYCQREKARIVGYKVEDLAYYSTTQIAELLPAMFKYDVWDNTIPREAGMPHHKTAPDEGGTRLAMLSDMSSAFDGLRKADKALVARVFKCQETSEADIPEVERVLRGMQRFLGGPPPRERRRVLSNREAQAKTDGLVAG